MENGRIRLGLSGLIADVASVIHSLWISFTGKLSVQAISLSLLDCAAAFVLSRANFLGRFSPLGIAYAAACLCGHTPKRLRGKGAVELIPLVTGLGGAVAGSLILGQGDPLRYISACAILTAAGLIFRGANFLSQRWFLPCMTAFSMLSTGTAFTLSVAGTAVPLDICLMICESGLCTGFAVLYDAFRMGMHPWSKGGVTAHKISGSLGGWELEQTERALSSSQRAAILGAFASFCMVLFSCPAVWGVRPGNLLVNLGVLAAAYAGPLPAAACGLIFGFSLDLSQLSAPLYASLYGFSGLFSSLYRRRSSFLIAVTFITVNAMTTMWHPEPKSALLEGFVASILFLLFSERFAIIGGLLFPSNIAHTLPVQEESEAIRYLRTRVDELSDAFASLGKFCASSGQQDDAAIENIREYEKADGKVNMGVFNIAIDRTCRNCAIRDICWNRDYSGTRQAISDASSAIFKRGRASAEDFPPHFTLRCVRLSEFLCNLNEAIAASNYRKRFRRRIREDNRLLCAQYDGMTRVLGELMDEFCSIPERHPDFSERLSRRVAALGINASVSVFRETSGRFSVRISSSDELSQHVSDILRFASEILERDMVLLSPMEDQSDDEETMTLQEREPLCVSVGVGMRPKAGEKCCGDSGSCFKTPDGKFCLLISDGMGAGDFAERQSSTLARLLESFLRSGIRPQTALRLVCPAFALRSEGEAFASVDLVCVDLYTGNAEFYKCGAAPSYISSPGKALRRITSAALPAGLFAPGTIEAERTDLTLTSGDTIILASDGATSGEDDIDFVRFITRRTSADVSAADLAMGLLKDSAEECDDATVLVLKLSAR